MNIELDGKNIQEIETLIMNLLPEYITQNSSNSKEEISSKTKISVSRIVFVPILTFRCEKVGCLQSA